MTFKKSDLKTWEIPIALNLYNMCLNASILFKALAFPVKSLNIKLNIIIKIMLNYIKRIISKCISELDFSQTRGQSENNRPMLDREHTKWNRLGCLGYE